MKFSIITPTWNSETSIELAQRSLAKQQFPREDLEWIVVDGASTDQTVERIKGGQIQPDRLLSEPDEGIYDALNKGVTMATGEFIGFLHADDFLDSPDVLKSIAGTLETSGSEAVYGDLQYVRSLGNDEFEIVRHWRSGAYRPRKLRWGWMPPHPTLYLKREVYERARRADGSFFDTAFSCAADYDFMLRIFSKHAIEPTYLRKVLVKMSLGGVSNRSLRHILQKSKEDWQVIRKNRIGHIHTLAWKNLSKLGQFIPRS